jgi:HD superfamily phosphohydrolase
VLCAALLHDIGHGPFSHTAEEVFALHHEAWTRRIIHSSPAVNQLLMAHSPELPKALEQIYTHCYPVPLAWQLVSSQLDCDRLDYLMRDSYFTGANYGRLDLDRILLALEFDADSGELVVAHKGLASIEHYLVVRFFMYAQVYNHPKNLAATWLLVQAFLRARELLSQNQLTADDTVTAWLQQRPDPLSLETYLAGDDIVFQYHLQLWQHSPDRLLADLCRRWVNRDLLKTLEVTALPAEQQQHLLSQVQAELAQKGLEATAYSGLKHTWSSGYTLYHQGIKLYQDGQTVDINRVSPLIQTLTESFERSWLLYPRESQAWVRQQWQTYSSGWA